MCNEGEKDLLPVFFSFDFFIAFWPFPCLEELKNT
jgi:hypothetical protein